ncbi:MAG: hypothetical protein WA705_27905 [Candidatus Ozemobacteraceae bacterium]
MIRRGSIFFFVVLFTTFLSVPAGAWQLIVTGNWGGRLATFNSAGEAIPGPAWRVPALITGLTRHCIDKTLVISVGNLAGGDTPAGFLSEGRFESALSTILEKEHRLAATALGPGDLFLARTSGILPENLCSSIWTNVFPPRGPGRTFEQIRILPVDGRRIGVACLIEESLLVDTTLFDGPYTIEDPARSIRRLRVEHPNAWDQLLVVCHLHRETVKKLQGEIPDDVRLLWVPPPGESVARSDRTAGFLGSGMWSVPEGDTTLLTIRDESSRGHPTAPSFRYLPLAKASENTPQAFFRTATEIAKRGSAVFRVLRDKDNPSALAYRFAPSLHARLARELFRADLAILTLEPAPILHEADLSLGLITRVVPPRRLRLYEFAGGDLELLLTQLLRTAPTTPIGFDGGRLSYLGGTLHNIIVSGVSLNRETRYRIVLDEDFYLYPLLQRFLRPAREVTPRGLSIWDAWASFAMQQKKTG